MTPADDSHRMRRALHLALRGLGWTSPNPMVGAVILKRGRVIAEGWHRAVGGPHAEVWALQAAGEAATGATIYLNLEPCCHHGRTPPCTDTLIAARVGRVVTACRDPDPRVSGKGIARLRLAGIAVHVGLLQAEAQRLNEAYFKRVQTGLPFVTLKSAMSLDGKIATVTGESKWITGEKARAFGHRLRAQHDAVLTGIGTVLADDPELTVRLAKGRTPLRVVADSGARTPPTARLLTADERPPIIAVTRQAPAGRVGRLQKAGAAVWSLPGRHGRVDLPSLMQRLAATGANSVLVEAGGTLAAAALEAGLVDRVYLFLAPILIGGVEAPTPLQGRGARRLADARRLSSVRMRRLGEDMLIVGDVNVGQKPCAR